MGQNMLSPQLTPESKVFLASPWRRLDEFLLIAVFSAVFGLTLYLWITQGFNWSLVMLLPLWTFMFVGSIGYSIMEITRVAVGDDHVEFRSVVRKILVKDSEVADIQIDRSGSSSMLKVSLLSGKDVSIRLSVFPGHAELADVLQRRYRDQEANAIQSALASNKRFYKTQVAAWGSWICGFVLIVALAWLLTVPSPSDRWAAWTMMTLGSLLIGLFFAARKSYAQVSSEGILSHIFWIDKRVWWHEITEIELTNFRTKSSVHEMMRIGSPKAMLWLGDGFDNYPFLRDIILSKVPQERVTDRRWE